MDYQEYPVEGQRDHILAQLRNYESQHFQHDLITQEHEAAAAGEADDEAGRQRAEQFREAAVVSRRSAAEAANRAAVYSAALKSLDDKSKGSRAGK